MSSVKRILRRLLRRWMPAQYASGGYIPPLTGNPGDVPFLLDGDRVWTRRPDGAWVEIT
jgi:hypothetical protein